VKSAHDCGYDGGFDEGPLGDAICSSCRSNLCANERMRPRQSDGGSSSYYELPRDCKQLLDVITSKDMSYTQGEIFKAAYRWDVKPDKEYNLRKILYFAQYELDRIYSEMKADACK